MKKQIYTAAALAAMLSLGACTTQKRQLSVSPSPCHIETMADGSFTPDILVKVPKDYLSSRSRVVLTPQLAVGDSVVGEFTPIVVERDIYRKKRERLAVLEGINDPLAASARHFSEGSEALNVRVNQPMQLPTAFENAQLRLEASTDGCGQCTGFETIALADIANPPLPDLSQSLEMPVSATEFVVRPKVVDGRGEAHLQFYVNKYDIVPSLGDNLAELNGIKDRLQPILGDSLAPVTSIYIKGTASAEGSLAHNERLARNRALSAQRWLVGALGISPKVARMISVGSRPEGWEPVLDAMVAAGDPDASAVREILDKYASENDDVQERYIRRLPCWQKIYNTYLQKDRKVEYQYTYTLRGFTTDAELMDMYTKRPDAFNAEELLRVAELTKGDAAKTEVYRRVLAKYPANEAAAVRLASILVRQGRAPEALDALKGLQNPSPEALNILGSAYAAAGQLDRAAEILGRLDSDAARQNLKTVLLHKSRQAK